LFVCLGILSLGLETERIDQSLVLECQGHAIHP